MLGLRFYMESSFSNDLRHVWKEARTVVGRNVMRHVTTTVQRRISSFVSRESPDTTLSVVRSREQRISTRVCAKLSQRCESRVCVFVRCAEYEEGCRVGERVKLACISRISCASAVPDATTFGHLDKPASEILSLVRPWSRVQTHHI